MNNTKICTWRSVLLLWGVSVLLHTPSSFGHGFTEIPKARQTICKEQGGYWWPEDGSGIPNQACRASFLISGHYPFTQDHEVAANVADYLNLDAVKAAIPDGSLCSAGSSLKAGLNVASPHWQKTTVTPDSSGKVLVRFNAQVPHNPSFWRFYLSKPSFNADTDVLNWDDLQLVSSFDDTPFYTAANGQRYYDFQVSIPAERQGQALLFTRWQRYDAAGEGFYNCSDIIIDSDTTTPDVWHNLGYFVRQDQTVNVGDNAWLRLFDASGSELINESFVITQSNVANWQSALAAKVTSMYASIVNIGVRDSAGNIIFDEQNVGSNQVWATNAQYSYQLTIVPKSENRAPVVQPLSDITLPEGGTANVHAHAYDDDQDPLTYSWSVNGDATVSGTSADATVTAKQVSQDSSAVVTVSVSDGKVSTSQSFNVSVLNDTTSPDAPLWDPLVIYLEGDRVSYNSQVYVAKWWSQNNQPDLGDPWQLEVSSNGEWQVDIAYSQGDEVMYQGQRFRAKWWTKGEAPGSGNAWQAL